MGLKKSAKCYILQHENTMHKLQAHHFDAVYWRNKQGCQVVDGGRGGSIKIDIDGQAAILRQYRRGGFMRSIATDHYIWLGIKYSRPWREWTLLREACTAGLPVSKPLGACVWKSGLTYQAAIITAFIESTQTLADYLEQAALDRAGWYQLGVTIKNMQTLGFRHADLNANNLLIDQNSKIYVIDFDKGCQMKKLDDWQWSVLYRLQRSLQKINKQKALYYRQDDWQALMDGYQANYNKARISSR